MQLNLFSTRENSARHLSWTFFQRCSLFLKEWQKIYGHTVKKTIFDRYHVCDCQSTTQVSSFYSRKIQRVFYWSNRIKMMRKMTHITCLYWKKKPPHRQKKHTWCLLRSRNNWFDRLVTDREMVLNDIVTMILRVQTVIKMVKKTYRALHFNKVEIKTNNNNNNFLLKKILAYTCYIFLLTD